MTSVSSSYHSQYITRGDVTNVLSPCINDELWFGVNDVAYVIHFGGDAEPQTWVRDSRDENEGDPEVDGDGDCPILLREYLREAEDLQAAIWHQEPSKVGS